MAWTAASIFPASFLRDRLAATQVPAPGTALTPEQKLRLSGGVTRRALNEAVTSPASTGTGGAATRRDTQTVASTGSGLTAPTPVSTNQPEFLTSGQNQTTPLQSQDILSVLQDLISGQRQDPDLVKAQTVLAQQQAMQVARDNQAARERESNLAAQGYLQSQLQDASQYTTGSVGNILQQRYSDRLKILQSGQPLNWLTMPSSSFSVPRRSGWTGPAMPTPGFGF